VEAFVLSDGDLVRAARAGDASCLGLLLERHLADMRAVAVALLGYGPDAEDAVQDAMLAALRSLDELRDLDAVGAWLRTIVRNACRMQFRAVRPVVELQWDVAGGDSAEEVLDRHALRDWVWHAARAFRRWLRRAASRTAPSGVGRRVDPGQHHGHPRSRTGSRSTRSHRARWARGRRGGGPDVRR
jgi:DNA-directed RNA polymerase specialized sigma24 family protein